MSVVSLVPHHDRPFVDGSAHDSVFAQVFDYNGVIRFQHKGDGVGQPAPFLLDLVRQGRTLGLETAEVPAGWHRLLTGPLGRDGAWLLPAAVLSLALIGWSRRRSDRRDPVRAAAIMWGCWLAMTFVAFSEGRYVNSYYVAALSPAVAAIVALGASVVVCGRFHTPKLAVVVAGVVATTGYSLYLLHRGSQVAGWLVPTLIAVSVVALIGLVLAVRSNRRVVVTSAAVFTALAFVLVPATASATAVTRSLGPFDSPFEPQSVTLVTQSLSRNLPEHIASGKRLRAIAPLRLATESSGLAENIILFSGREVLPIGGFTGAVPSPTLAQIENDINRGEFRMFEIAVVPPTPDPRLDWIRRHCDLNGSTPEGSVTIGEYFCPAQSAAPGSG